MPREFDLSDVLSVVPGCLVSTRHVDGVVDILQYMTGDVLMTHVLPRASEACEPALIAQHPWLASVDFSEWKTTGEGREAECAAWVAEMKARYGETVTVYPLTEWHKMNPIQEFIELTEQPNRVIGVIASR